MKSQGTLNRQNVLGKEQYWRTHTSGSQTFLQIYNSKNNRIVPQGQIYRAMEENRETKIKSSYKWLNAF